MYAQRGIAAMLDFARDISEVYEDEPPVQSPAYLRPLSDQKARCNAPHRSGRASLSSWEK